MKAVEAFELLKLAIMRKKNVKITIEGISMMPSLYQGDIVTICKSDYYSEGDIVVYMYKGEILSHRILKIEDNIFFCKGDNSFRIEDVNSAMIVGKVVEISGREILQFDQELIELSFMVGREFKKNKFNKEITTKSELYSKYKNLLREKIKSMKK